MTTEDLRRSLIPLLLLLPALGALLYTFQHMEANHTTVPVELPTPPRYTLTDADLVRYDSDGTPSLHGEAHTVEYFDDDSGHATQVQVDLLGDDNEVAWHLISATALQPPHDKRILLDSPVLATGRWPDSGEAVTVTTAKVWIDPNSHVFQTDQPVAARSATRTADAIGMNADWLAQRLRLLRDVKTVYVAHRQ
jgi:LPS export ABC transporter protein LptC